MSRPSLSCPSQCAAEGGASPSLRLCWSGSKGDSQGAKRETRMKRVRKKRPIDILLSRFILFPFEFGARPSFPLSLPDQPDTGIGRGIKEIDQEVGEEIG